MQLKALSLRRQRAEGLPLPAALRSAVLSGRNGAWGPHGPLITASWGSRIERHPTARLDLQGPLLLGHWPSGPPTAVPARVQLHEGATLKVTGWAVLAGGSVVVVGPGATLELNGSADGEGVIVSTGARVICMELITIGPGTGLSWDAHVVDTDHHHVVDDASVELSPYTQPVHLGARVMVGARATVLKGVSVGDDAVIGTGAIVTRDVAGGALVVGNPAKVIREGVRWY